MSEKELLYVEDALNQLKLLTTKCSNYANQMQNRELKAYLKDLESRNQSIFNQIFKVLE